MTRPKAKSEASIAPLRVMVASSVYGFEDQIRQICGTFTGYGYVVLNSFMGSIPNSPSRSNLEDCLAAVETCDLFFGIIRPLYGSGKVGERAITHEEMRHAVSLRKPRWFVVDPFVPKARTLLRQYRFTPEGKRIEAFAYQATAVMDDVRVIDMYDDVTQHGTPVEQRRGYWVQPCSEILEILKYIEFQFKDVPQIRAECGRMQTERLAEAAKKATKVEHG